MIGIFLDDERFPHDVKWIEYPKHVDWIIVRDYWDFVYVIRDSYCDNYFVSFDHDLMCFDDDKEYTGMDCLKWLIGYCVDNNKQIPVAYFHTKNPIGEKNMKEYYDFCLVKFGG